MSLSKYNKKRNFKITNEPEGIAEPKRSGLPKRSVVKNTNDRRYLIQKHDASHLHYDFRLEHKGVLKSWAVPKGPSIDPSVKRLAVEVEDHPLNYGDFEGTIPKGEYGGGTVMLWDQGDWEPSGDVDAGLKKGHLLFRLNGKRLKGEWNLVRSHGKADADKPLWFLIKAKREKNSKSNASKTIHEPTSKFVKSVVSGRTMDDIANASSKVWHSEKSKKKDKLTKAIFVKPQLCTLVSQVPLGKDFIHEVKFDGYRMQAVINKSDKNHSLKLISRNGNDWTSKLESLKKPLLGINLINATLDGEVVILNKDGLSQFQDLQNAFDQKKTSGFVFYVFDILFLNGKDLRTETLENRKIILKTFLEPLPKSSVIRFSDHIKGRANKLLENACRIGLEGIVSKNKNSIYQSLRTIDWVKTKCEKRQEFVIVGYSAPKGSRSSLGALLLAIYNSDGVLTYSGRVGTGFDSKQLSSIEKKLSKIKCDERAVEKLPKGTITRDVTWVKPVQLCEVKFSSWTTDRVLRHPVFVGLREDKSPKDAVIEKVGALSDMVCEIQIKKPRKVMFRPKTTKLDLARYYDSVKDLMLPYLKGRPISIVRCPDGFEKTCFFQKHPQKENGFITINTEKDLIGYSNQGALEFHIWGSTLENLEKPDILVFDLDPDEKLPWSRVVEAALYLHDVLKKMKLESFLKTTGGKGLHIAVPLLPEKTWLEVKKFSQKVAEGMAALSPDLYTATMGKNRRKGKIFIDYLRNTRGATFVAPFSTRARAGATVSVPIAWSELKDKALHNFTIGDLEKRAKPKKVSPWKHFFKLKQRLPDISKK